MTQHPPFFRRNAITQQEQMMFPKKLAAPAEDSELNDDDGPVSSTAPVLPAEPAGVSVAAWFPAVADLLDKGVPVRKSGDLQPRMSPDACSK